MYILQFLEVTYTKFLESFPRIPLFPLQMAPITRPGARTKPTFHQIIINQVLKTFVRGLIIF